MLSLPSPCSGEGLFGLSWFHCRSTPVALWHAIYRYKVYPLGLVTFVDETAVSSVLTFRTLSCLHFPKDLPHIVSQLFQQGSTVSVIAVAAAIARIFRLHFCRCSSRLLLLRLMVTLVGLVLVNSAVCISRNFDFSSSFYLSEVAIRASSRRVS